MKENELRLNNLVMVNYKTDLLSKVTWIQEGSINVIFDRQPDLINGVVCSVNDLIAIKLTEEWLLKAGYKKQNGYGYSNYNIYGTILKNDTSFEFHYYGIIIKLDFVHQLQNLFFSLYGKDLVFSTEP